MVSTVHCIVVASCDRDPGHSNNSMIENVEVHCLQERARTHDILKSLLHPESRERHHGEPVVQDLLGVVGAQH